MLGSNKVKIQFLGATGTVTGSKFLVSFAGKRVLIDCGLFQGLKHLRLKNWEPFPIDPKKIDAVLFTHAHIDHTGYFPIFCKNGFTKTAYTTPATKALLEILLPDSAYLQEEEAKYLNKHQLSKHKPALPLYNVDDANKSLEHIHAIDWDQKFEITKGFSFRFLPISHLLGASAIEITVGGKTIVFSGDIGRNNDPLLPTRAQIFHADCLLTESTYGDRMHEKEDVLEILAGIINTTFNRSGSVIIPSFAVGRAQLLLYYINKLKEENRIPNIPVYLNSPMAIDATDIYEHFASSLKISVADLKKAFANVTYVRDARDSIELTQSKKPAIILSASGMITGGRILHILKHKGPDARNSIILVGFQAAGTRGEALLRGKKEIKIHGEMIPINASVHTITSLSSHADYNEILDWLGHFSKPPKQTFVIHGEPVACDEMRKHIEETLHWNCTIPEYLQEIEV